MEDRGLWNEDKERAIRSSLRKDVLAAFDRAEKKKKPAMRHAFDDVWEEVTEEQRAHVEELKDILTRYPKEYDVGQYEGGIGSLDELLERKK